MNLLTYSFIHQMFSNYVLPERHFSRSFDYTNGVAGGMNWEIGIDVYTLICIK